MKTIIDAIGLAVVRIIREFCKLVSISPATFDAFLWGIIGGCTAALGVLSTEEAYKYVDPYRLWNIKLWMTGINGAAIALKTFRSTTYAKHLESEANKEPDKPGDTKETKP